MGNPGSVLTTMPSAWSLAHLSKILCELCCALGSKTGKKRDMAVLVRGRGSSQPPKLFSRKLDDHSLAHFVAWGRVLGDTVQAAKMQGPLVVFEGRVSGTLTM